MKPVDLSSRRVAPAHLMVLKFKVQHLQACQESMYICRFQLKPVDLHVIFLDNEIYRNKYENSLFYIADDLGSIIYRFHRIVKTLKVHKSSAPQTPVVVFFHFPMWFWIYAKKTNSPKTTSSPHKKLPSKEVHCIDSHFCATAIEPLSTACHPCAWGHARNSNSTCMKQLYTTCYIWVGIYLEDV